MLHQTVEAVFPFRQVPPKPKPKTTKDANSDAATANLAKKAPAWDSVAQAAQAAAEAELAAKAAASNELDLGGNGDASGDQRPVSPLPHPMSISPEDLLFFSPGDRIIVLQQFRGSPWWLGAVKLCTQEQAHSRLRAMERLNAAATHSEIASSPILAKASNALRARARSIANVNGSEPPNAGQSSSTLGVGGVEKGASQGAPVLAGAIDTAGGGEGGDHSSPNFTSTRERSRDGTPANAGAAAAALVLGAGGGKGGLGALTNDSITAKLVRHASRKSVAQQLDAAQKEVTMQNSFANIKMALGDGDDDEEESEEAGDGLLKIEGRVLSGANGDMGSPSPPLSFDGSPSASFAIGGKPPKSVALVSGLGSGVASGVFSLEAAMEKSVLLDDTNNNNNNTHTYTNNNNKATDDALFSNSSFSFRPGKGADNMNASFAGGLVSNSSFFINRDLGNAMEKALLDIPGNYNAGKPYDAAIDGELFNFKSQAAVVFNPTSPESGSNSSPVLGPKRSSNLAVHFANNNASFSSMPMNTSFRLGDAAFAFPTGSPNAHSSPTGMGPQHQQNGKTIYRLDAYKIGLFYVPFTRNLEDIAKLSTSATEEGRKAKEAILKDVNRTEKPSGARSNAGDGGVAKGGAGGGGSSSVLNDARNFSVPMEAKTSALRSAQEKEAGAAGVKYHGVLPPRKTSLFTSSDSNSRPVTASGADSPAASAAGGASSSSAGMYYQTTNAPSAGRGKQQQMSDEDDRRLRKLLGLDDDDDDTKDSATRKDKDVKDKTKKEGGSVAGGLAQSGPPLSTTAGFEGSEFRKALIEMQNTSDQSHTQEQLDAARIRLLRTLIVTNESSFDRASVAAAAPSVDHNTTGGSSLMVFGGNPLSVTGDAIHDQITHVHRQILDKVVGLRTDVKKLKHDSETLTLRERMQRETIKAEARALRGGSVRKAQIVTSLLPSVGGANDDDGADFDLTNSFALGGSTSNFMMKGRDRAGSPSPTNPNAAASAFELLQCEVEIMKARLKLTTLRRDHTTLRVDTLNCYADGVEEEAPDFNAHGAVEKESQYSEELAAIIANGGRPLSPPVQPVAVRGGGSLGGSVNRSQAGAGGLAEELANVGAEGLNASFAGASSDHGAGAGGEGRYDDRPPSPPTEAELIEEPKAKRLLKKILKRLEEADITLEDYQKQKRKLEKRIEKNGNVLKEITKAMATHTESQLQRQKLIREALGDAAGGLGAAGSDVVAGDDEDEDDEDAAIARASLPAPELPPTMGAAAKKKAKNPITAAEHETDPLLLKVHADVRHQVKLLCFDPEGIPDHKLSLEMIEKCMAAVEKLQSKTKKAQKNSSANAEATAELKAERDKLVKKLAKGDAAVAELERTIKFTQHEIDSIQKQAANAKTNFEIAEKELAAKKALSADIIKSWRDKKKEAGKDIEALKAKITSEKERVAKFEIELKQLEEKRAAADAAEAK